MKRIERRRAAATALGIELAGKPMWELKKLLADDDGGAQERYAAIVGTTPTPDPEPEPEPAADKPAKPARKTPAKKPAGKSGKVANPGKSLTDALAKANSSMNGTEAKASA
jgi:hypothetical protein